MGDIEKSIDKWKTLTSKITERFIREYFDVDKKEAFYYSWVDIGGVFNFADYWLDFNTVLVCYELGVTKEQLFEHYDKTLTGEIDLPLREFIISPKKLKQQREKHLEELKQRIEVAKEELEKAIKGYE